MLKMLLHNLQKIENKVLKAADHSVSWLQVSAAPNSSGEAGQSSGGMGTGGTATPQDSSMHKKSTITGCHWFSPQFCAAGSIPCLHLTAYRWHITTLLFKRALRGSEPQAGVLCCQLCLLWADRQGQARTCLSLPSADTNLLKGNFSSPNSSRGMGLAKSVQGQTQGVLQLVSVFGGNSALQRLTLCFLTYKRCNLQKIPSFFCAAIPRF